MLDYQRDAATIDRESFAAIRAEAELTRFPPDVEQVVAAMIQACGQVDLAHDVAFTPGVATAARRALGSGAAILCDSEMIASGVIRTQLPVRNEVLCTIGNPMLHGMSIHMNNTRAATALEFWRGAMAGAVVAIGNAPTALFRLLDMIMSGAPRPAVILGMPAGFVGAAESKEALMAFEGIEFLTVRGRRGGSAVTVAAVNALAVRPYPPA